jgi:hypothetical protein
MASRSTRLRKLTKSEHIRLGLKPSRELHVDASLKRITKRTRLYSKAAAIKLRTGMHPTKLAAAHRAGELPYKSVAAAEQAAKTRATRKVRRDVRKIEKVRHPDGYQYTPTDAQKNDFIELRKRKLAGEWIADGEWHGMMDVAQAANDPQVTLLRRSPVTTSEAM